MRNPYLLFLPLLFFLFSCESREESANHPKPTAPTPSEKPEEVASVDTFVSIEGMDTISGLLLRDTAEALPERREKALPPPPPKPRPQFERMMGYPGNEHFNGKPLIYQIDLPKKQLEAAPDTLIEIVKQAYLSYEGAFPVSIADNFEEGISTEKIHYPKLHFNVQVFEDSYAEKPHTFRRISVRKRDDAVEIER